MIQRLDRKKFAKRKSRSLVLTISLVLLLIFLWSGQNWLYQSSFGLVGSKVSGWFLGMRSFFIDRQSEQSSESLLRQENQKLIEENAKLKEELLEKGTSPEKGFSERFKIEEINVTGKESFFGQPLLFALKRADLPIRSGLAVVDKNGFLVGLTDQADARTLQIVLAQNHHFRVGAKVAGTDWTGVVAGSHDLRSVLEMLPLEASIEPGAPVVTDNSNPEIPAGISIGKLAQVSESDDHLFKEALLELPWKSESFLKLWVVTGVNY